ncbi:hypothetical protein PSAB6_580041 [Paraburkholderia sabiae]|nr:hypothetical protein PSAB6_580041 [Paraburkholderia sabiae]
MRKKARKYRAKGSRSHTRTSEMHAHSQTFRRALCRASSWQLAICVFVPSSTAQPGGSYRVIEIFVRRNVPMIDTYQPPVISKTPTDTTLLDQACKPSPNVCVLCIDCIRRVLPDLS